MKSYPKIEYYNQEMFGERIIAFDKLDGSNIRFEWNKKSGWYKFGTRNTMIDKNDLNFGEAIPIFLEKYSTDLEKVFKKNYSNAVSVVVFGEYHGPSSFAGRHLKEETKTVTLFDVNVYKRGFIPAYEFVENFGHLEIPDIIYKGELTKEFVEDIRSNKYELKEGVICKGVRKVRGTEIPWMIKVKSLDWIYKVKSLYGEEYLKEELNRDKKLIELYASN